MKFLILFLFICHPTFATKVKRKIASVDDKKRAQKVMENFIQCSKDTKQKFTLESYMKCTKKYLSNDLSEFRQKRFSSWPMRGISISDYYLCSEKRISLYNRGKHDPYDFVICFDFKMGDKTYKAVAGFIETEQLQISDIEY